MTILGEYMKKFIGIAIVVTLTILFCTACEVSNTELANSLDGNMTRLVYSIGYLDSISSSEINELVSNTSYFGGTNSNSNNDITGANYYRNSNYRTNSYSVAGTGTSNPLETATPKKGDAENSKLGGLFEKDDIVDNANLESNESTTQNGTNNFVDISLIQTSASDLNDILLAISQKRGIIMLYCTDLRSGNASLEADDKSAIREYIDIIKETTTFLNNSAGDLTAYLNNIKNVAYDENSQEIINAKLIRANEVLKSRYVRLDTCIDSLNAIISILQKNIGTDYSTTFLNNSNYTNNIPNSDLQNENNFNNGLNNTGLTNTENNTQDNLTDNNLNNNLPQTIPPAITLPPVNVLPPQVDTPSNNGISQNNSPAINVLPPQSNAPSINNTPNGNLTNNNQTNNSNGDCNCNSSQCQDCHQGSKPDTVINYYYDSNNLPSINQPLDTNGGYANGGASSGALGGNTNGGYMGDTSIGNSYSNTGINNQTTNSSSTINQNNGSPKLKTDEFNSPLTGDPRTQRSVSTPNPNSIISKVSLKNHFLAKFIMPIFSQEETFKLMPFKPNYS